VFLQLLRMLPFIEKPGAIMQGYLIGDEKVYFVDRPAPITLLSKEVLGAFGAIVFLTVVIGTSSAIVLGFFATLAVLAWVGVKSVRYRYTRYVITSLRVMRMTGIFDRKYYWIPWQKVTDLGYHQSILGRIFGYASISIDSANEQSGLKLLNDLDRPWEFQHWLAVMVGRRQRYYNPDDTSEEAAAAAAAAEAEAALWD
jgi:uncharacterized membrane protein YdbT with pleckstrin-like domain